MKNIHFINVFFFGQTRALDVFFFFFFFLGGGGGGDCIKRKKKTYKSTGNSCVGKKTTTEQRVPPPTQRDKAQVHTPEDTNKHMQASKEKRNKL